MAAQIAFCFEDLIELSNLRRATMSELLRVGQLTCAWI